MSRFPLCLTKHLVALLALGSAATAFAAAPSLPPSKPLPVPTLKYEKYTLPNGLVVLLHEDHRLPLVAVDLWYHVGPVNEAAGRTGFAHLFEHMMFEGSEHVGEKAHFKYLEGAGASDINGTTDFDRTNYFETVPSNQLDLALWLESDRMGFLLETLDRQKLTNQRDVVRNERRQGENTPYDVADEEVFHQLFPRSHPYYANVIGSHADIESARLNDVRDFFHHYYTPNNANLAIAGDFDTAKLKALIVKYFGPIPRGPEVPAVDVKTPPITSERRATVTDTVQLPRVYVAWLTPPAFTRGDADADLFMRVLGGGKSSRLYRKLVYEKQIAQSADCTTNSLKLDSIAQCEITARPGIKPEDLEAAVNTEIESLRTSGPTQAELDGARNVQLTHIISGLQRLGGFGGVADRMDLYNYYLDDPGYLPKDIARYQHATIASVKNIGQNSFGTNQRVVVYAVPGKKVLEDVPRSPDDTDANVKVANPYDSSFETRQDWRKTPPQPGPPPAFHLPSPKTFALSNGMKVYLVEDHALPVMSANFVTMAGGDANPESKPGLAGFTARLLTEGTKERSSVDLAQATDSIGATLATAAGVNNASASIGNLSNSTDAGIDLLSDVVLHPAFAPEEIERIRKQRLTAILQEEDQPIASTLRVGLKAVYGNQPYGFRPIGTTASVKSITREDLTGFWAAHYSPKSSALVLAGDLTETEAHRLAERYFASWGDSNSDQAAAALPAPPTAPSRKIIIVDKPGSPQTVLIAFGLGVPRTVPDYPSVEVMNSVLGGLFSSRINMNLREKNGYTYGAFSQFAFDRAGGPFYAGALVRTDVTAPATKELFSELDRIKSDPPSAEELKLAQEFELRSLPGNFETVKETTKLIGDLFTFNLPNDYYQSLPARFESVTAPAVEKAAQQDIHPGQMIVVAVGDRAKIESGLKQLNLGPIEYRDEMGEALNK